MLKGTVQVEYDPITDDYVLPLTDEMIDALGIEHRGEILRVDNKDGSWTLRKKEDNV